MALFACKVGSTSGEKDELILLRSGITGGATIDCTAYPNYQELTSDDFVVSMTSYQIWCDEYGQLPKSQMTSRTLGTWSYNPSTGMLSVPSYTSTLAGVNTTEVRFIGTCSAYMKNKPLS